MKLHPMFSTIKSKEKLSPSRNRWPGLCSRQCNNVFNVNARVSDGSPIRAESAVISGRVLGACAIESPDEDRPSRESGHKETHMVL